MLQPLYLLIADRELKLHWSRRFKAFPFYARDDSNCVTSRSAPYVHAASPHNGRSYAHDARSESSNDGIIRRLGLVVAVEQQRRRAGAPRVPVRHPPDGDSHTLGDIQACLDDLFLLVSMTLPLAIRRHTLT